ncbi:MFS transporter [Sphaerisporangium krabiense]|uniref:EmrB/QacA subfamily drug resistance transporter n=1 Tax=Sphaerisporangium krabiense TaxID=763782 RepID=A0A7W9DNS8_9ACTN|nr:MFS transporter [Sphaerisporangium krabiense]MBB5625329.1 EmrB/QacA subfamily drug resistance transporter [Sphaerisporangium krabiense]GII64157.1 MFS transporter [Sphaerisporangium krabiense]
MTTAVPAGVREAAPDPAPPMSHKEILEALSGLLLGMFVAILSSTVVSNALPTIIAELHADETTYTWVITSVLLATTISTPLWGKLADLVSKKILVQLGLIIYIIGSAIAGLSQNPGMLIGARVIQGLGAGGLTALAQVIMAAIISPRERGRYSGYLGAVFALATIGGPLIGGVIVDTSWLGWRWCFYVGVPFAVIALIVLQKTLHVPVLKREVKIDWTGAVLITASVSLLLVWVSFAGNKYDWLSWQTGAMVGGAVVLALLFLLVETRAREPIVPLRLFRSSAISLAVAASMFVGIAMFGATTFLSQYFQLARGETPTMAGVMTLPMILGLALSSTIAGQIITRTGRWKIFLVVGGLFLTAGFGLMATLRYDTNYWILAVYMFCIGVGVGMTMQNLVLSVQNQVRPEELGAASSVVAFFRTLGGAIGVSALGAVLGNRVMHYMDEGLTKLGLKGHAAGDGTIPQLSKLPLPIRTVVESSYGHGVGDVFMYAAPFALLALLIILFIKEIPLRTSNADPIEVPGADERATAPGRHAQRDTVVAESNGHAVNAFAGEETRTLGGGAAVATRAEGGSGIRGFITGSDGAPVGHATLTLIDVRGHQLGRAVTQADGSYDLWTPGGGTYVLIASAGDHDPQVATLAVGDQPLDFDLVLSGSGKLTGMVVGAGGGPVAEAMVVVTDVRGEVVSTGTTDAAGMFGFAGIVAGVYTLTVSAEGHRPTAAPVEVGTGQTRQDIQLLPAAQVRGTIRVKDGGPLADARVTILDAAGNVVGSATTGVDGEYAFADLTGGQYTVVAAGYPPVANTITLNGRGDEPYDVWLGHAD